MMKTTGKSWSGARLAVWALAAVSFLPLVANASVEESFDVLKIGTITYSNVTVTTKTPSYVVIMHTTGMTSVKIKDLPLETQIALGYAAPEPAAAPRTESYVSSQIASKMAAPQVAKIQQAIRQSIGKYLPAEKINRAFVLAFLHSRPGMILLGAFALLHLFFSLWAKLVIEKTGNEASALVWVPVLNVIELGRAAGMSPLAALAIWVPVFNIAIYIVWCLRISKALGKSTGLAVLLMVPGPNILGLLYLPFASAPRAFKPLKAVEIMTLEAA